LSTAGRERRGFTLIGAIGGREGLDTIRQIKPETKPFLPQELVQSVNKALGLVA